jgi:hypothetical protein
MKKLAIAAFAFVTCLTAADNSGIWKGKGGFEDLKYGSVPATAILTLVQAGSTVSGTLKIGNGPLYTLSAGTVSGNQITFAVGKGGTGSLTLNGTTLQGKLTSSTGKILDIVFTK